jgi:glycosyltransferase involved in cell wall biosynthesis
VEDVGLVLAAGDVFVHASKSEGLSNAVLEAMSAGLPLVVSDIPANREAADGCANFFSPGDWRGCLQRLKELAADKAAAERSGKMARQRVERLFNRDRIIKRRERLYRKLAEAANGRAR